MQPTVDAGALAQLSERELDLMLGEHELSGAAGSQAASEAEKVAVGRSYFSDVLPAIREQICGNETIATLFAGEYKERNDIIIAVGGMLTGISPVPYLLAARAIHYGYGQLCPGATK